MRIRWGSHTRATSEPLRVNIPFLRQWAESPDEPDLVLMTSADALILVGAVEAAHDWLHGDPGRVDERWDAFVAALALFEFD